MTNAERYAKAAERAEGQKNYAEAARYWDQCAEEAKGEPNWTPEQVKACQELARMARKQAAGNTRADQLAVL